MGREQVGTVRTNCIDSLDRTNVAQFIVSRVALAYQLHAMGISTEPILDDRSEVCSQYLVEMYLDMLCRYWMHSKHCMMKLVMHLHCNMVVQVL